MKSVRYKLVYEQIYYTLHPALDSQKFRQPSVFFRSANAFLGGLRGRQINKTLLKHHYNQVEKKHY